MRKMNIDKKYHIVKKGSSWGCSPVGQNFGSPSSQKEKGYIKKTFLGSLISYEMYFSVEKYTEQELVKMPVDTIAVEKIPECASELRSAFSWSLKRSRKIMREVGNRRFIFLVKNV